MPTGIDAALTVAEVLERWPTTAVVFVRRSMACVGCAMAPFDTIGEAAAAFGVHPEAFLGELRLLAAAKEGGRK